jgi:hypothetical protein
LRRVDDGVFARTKGVRTFGIADRKPQDAEPGSGYFDDERHPVILAADFRLVAWTLDAKKRIRHV